MLRAKGLIATLQSDADNLFVILSAKALKPSLLVSARVASEQSEKKLRLAGADYVFAPYDMTGNRMAQVMLKPHVFQFIDFTTKGMGLDVGIEQFSVPASSEFASKSLIEARIRKELGVIVLAIRKSDGQMLFNPPADAEIQAGDYLIVMGEAANLRQAGAGAGRGARVKVLTAAQMREVDRRTAELGIPNIILMENAGQRVVEFLEREYAPLAKQSIVVVCGKGNNGGDGLVVARQLHTRVKPRWLRVVLAGDPDRDAGRCRWKITRCLRRWDARCAFEITDGDADGDAGDRCGAWNGHGRRGQRESGRDDRGDQRTFPAGGRGGGGCSVGRGERFWDCSRTIVRAKHTVTFTAPKPCLVLAPACELAGKVHVAPIGTPPELYEKDAAISLSVSDPADFAHLFQPRVADSNKGLYGHVLVIAGGRGKTGAAAMAGIAALRAGAGLSTVHRRRRRFRHIASYAPEIMTEPLAETDGGSIAMRAPDDPALARHHGEENRDRDRSGHGATSRDRAIYPALRARIENADGGGCRRAECAGWAAVAIRRASHFHAASRRDVALDRENDRGDSEGSHRPSRARSPPSTVSIWC